MDSASAGCITWRCRVPCRSDYLARLKNIVQSFKEWARWYVWAHGLAVFPLPPNRKDPGAIGIKSATRDLDQIDKWWNAEPLANIGVVGCLRVDIDTKHGGLEAWQALTRANGIPPTLTARTPRGGLHYYFRTPSPMGNGTGTLPPGIDIRGHETGYTVGPPSLTTAIDGKQCAGVYEFEDASAPIADAPDWLLTMIGAQRTASEKTEPLRTEITQEQLNDLCSALSHPLFLQDWKRWSDTGYALLSLGDLGRELWQRYSDAQISACPHETVIDTAESWWARHANSAPKSDYRSIFARAQAMGWKNPKATDTAALGFGMSQQLSGALTLPTPVPPPPRNLKAINGWEFANGPAASWMVDELIPNQGLVMVFGEPNCGKSFAVLDLVMSIELGKPYGADERKVVQSKTLYALAEGLYGFRSRLLAYADHHKLAPTSRVPDIVTTAPNLMTKEDTATMVEEATRIGAKLIVIDTLHAATPGADENSAQDMGLLLANCRILSAAIQGVVLLIHHSGKDTSKGARGSSSLNGAVDTSIEIEDTNGIRTARVRKQRDGESGAMWQFRLLPVIATSPRGVEKSAVVDHGKTATGTANSLQFGKRKRGSDLQQQVVDAVASLRGVYPDGVQMETLTQNILIQRPDLRADSVRRALTNLINRGLLIIDSSSNVRLSV